MPTTRKRTIAKRTTRTTRPKKTAATPTKKNAAAQALGRLGGLARSKSISKARASEIGRQAIAARHGTPWPPPKKRKKKKTPARRLLSPTPPAAQLPLSRCVECGGIVTITPTANPYEYDYRCEQCPHCGTISWTRTDQPPSYLAQPTSAHQPPVADDVAAIPAESLSTPDPVHPVSPGVPSA